MRILIDENIPFAKKIFQKIGTVTTIPGRLITQSSLKKIDVLIIRSVTQINETLLKNTKVKFIGTTTAGTDHVDKKLLKERGIKFSSAPGCNSISVVEYIFSVLYSIATQKKIILKEKIIGIIGVGNIGKQLNLRLKSLGIKTLLCDPPKENQNKKENFCSLEKIIKMSDIITLHPSLNKNEPFSTYHLFNKEVIQSISNKTILINSSRGDIIDNKELLKALNSGKKIDVILDVWENEPNISLDLLSKVKIGTFHIAGYSCEGKIRGAIHIFEKLNKFLNQKNKIIKLIDLLPVPKTQEIYFNQKLTQKNLRNLINIIYNVKYDDQKLRNSVHIPGQFDLLRKKYPNRREFSSLTIKSNCKNLLKKLKHLGFNTKITK